MDPDSDLEPAIFINDLQDANKKLSKRSHKTVEIKVFPTIFA
jgi:hypothetical protein